jgi:hypothetical protein
MIARSTTAATLAGHAKSGTYRASGEAGGSFWWCLPKRLLSKVATLVGTEKRQLTKAKLVIDSLTKC